MRWFLFLLLLPASLAQAADARRVHVIPGDPTFQVVFPAPAGASGLEVERLDVDFTSRDAYGEVTRVRRLGDTDIPVDTMMLVDTSASMGASFDGVKSALGAFIEGMSGGDRLLVVTFDEQVEGMDAAWLGIADRAQLTARVDALVADGRETHLYDALNRAVDRYEQEADPTHIRSIVVLSDGADYGSDTTTGRDLSRVRTNAKDAGCRIDAVGFLPTGTGGQVAVLQDLAADTGGLFVMAGSTSEIRTRFEELQRSVHDLAVVDFDVERLLPGPYPFRIVERPVDEQPDGAEASATVLVDAELNLSAEVEGKELSGNDAPDRTPIVVGAAAGALVVLGGLAVVARRNRLRREREAAEVQARLDAMSRQAQEANRPRRLSLQLVDRVVPLFEAESFGSRALGSDATQVQVVVSDDSVSRRHAVLERRADDPHALWVSDVGSSNGTYHEGLDVRGRGAVRVAVRTRVQFGIVAGFLTDT